MTDLHQELTDAQSAFEAARTSAERVANEEASALASDKTFAAWLRRKKIAEIEVERLNRRILQLREQIESERAEREREETRLVREVLIERRTELVDRVARLRDEIWPELRQLLADLAAFDRDRRDTGVQSVDAEFRHRRSEPEEIISDETVALWCWPGTLQPFHSQDIVMSDTEGYGIVSADFGMSKLKLELRRFRQISRYSFSPATDAAPLYRTLRMPRLDAIDADQFDGSAAYSEEHAIELLTRERRAHPRDVRVELIPLGRDDAPLSSQAEWSPPPIPV